MHHSSGNSDIILETSNLVQITFSIICLMAGDCCVVCNPQSEAVLNTM